MVIVRSFIFEESGKRRGGETELPVQPFIRTIDHCYNLCDYTFIFFVQFFKLGFRTVFAKIRYFEPYLGFACFSFRIASLAIKAALYLLLHHASPILAHTEREDLRIWSVSEYFSSDGNFFVISNISIVAFIAPL